MNAPAAIKRAVATTIDCLIFYVPYVLALTDFPDPIRLVGATAAVVALGVQARLLAGRGQTLGKIFMGHRVVSRSTGGNAGFWINAALRPFVAWAPNILCLSLGALPLWIAADGLTLILRKDALSLHDLICGTRVVEMNGENPETTP